MTGVRNIVFDIGNVLVRFEPLCWLARTYPNDFSRIQALYEHVFRSEEWLDLDRGAITPEGALKNISARIPEYHSEVEAILMGWEYFLIDEIRASTFFVRLFKDRGYRIYALSNYPRRAFINTQRMFEVFSFFDGKVVSWESGYLKPEREIYRILIEKYGLCTNECVFIDDMKVNIQTAEELGFHTVHFTGPNVLMRLFNDLENARAATG